MTALLLHTVLSWVHDQVEQTATGGATLLRQPPAIFASNEDDEPPDVVNGDVVVDGPT
jgi:hypothetical protein